MLFLLRKLIEALLLPVGISILLTLVGIFLRRRWIAVCGVVTLYMFSSSIVGSLMLEPLADAIVVLSGGVVRGITPPGVQWGASANRYFAGFDLAVAGKAKLIVFSGASSDDPQGRSQGAILRQIAIEHGIQPERIILTGSVLTTEDEARVVSLIPDVHSVLLVTSAFHMPRAVLLFRARGLDVSPFPTDNRILRRLKLGFPGFIPLSGGIDDSEVALREYYGLAAYHMLLWFQPLGRLRQ
jgi:uncharacterized SAM-binding protein YcdF (DUF218 family)